MCIRDSRFPAEAGYFTADSIPEYSTSGLRRSRDERRIVADYDNAVRYNDRVVGEILDRCRTRDAVVVYLSDHGEDVIWQCEAENVDLLLLETDFSPAAEDTKDVSARCDIAIEVRRRLPECKVYLACEDGCLEKLPALDKAVELALIDGYCVGSITPQQMRTWLNEAAEAMHRRESRRDWTCRQDVLSDE